MESQPPAAAVVATESNCTTTTFNSGQRIDEINEETVDWRVLSARVAGLYRDRTVTSILDSCFGESDNSGCGTSSKLKAAGILLHEYIELFFKRFPNSFESDRDEFVDNMLRQLQTGPSQLIAFDKLIHEKPKLNTIHIKMHRELVQFYNFLNNRKVNVFGVEYCMRDPVRNVHGRCNGLFRSPEHGFDDEHLILFDWTWSALMVPGSPYLQRKTLQLNIYKYILEKYNKMKIVKMCCVLFHNRLDDYEMFDVENIDLGGSMHL